MSQWISVLNLALELPFDAKEDAIWAKLLAEQSKFGEVFITTLPTIDLVRIPFIDYSFIRYFCKVNSSGNSNQEKTFLIIQNQIQIFLKQRILSELLALLQTEKEELIKNLLRLESKVNQLENIDKNKPLLKGVSSFLENLQKEIKELEEKEENEENGQEN